MKVRKDGSIRLDSNEVRAGNFVLRREPEHMVVTDIAANVSGRISRDWAMGKMLELIYAEIQNGGSDLYLKCYAAMIYLQASVVPDTECMEGVCRLYRECVARHPDVYGHRNASGTEKEDADAVREVKEMKEFEDSVRGFAGAAG